MVGMLVSYSNEFCIRNTPEEIDGLRFELVMFDILNWILFGQQKEPTVKVQVSSPSKVNTCISVSIKSA